MFNQFMWNTATITDANILLNYEVCKKLTIKN